MWRPQFYEEITCLQIRWISDLTCHSACDILSPACWSVALPALLDCNEDAAYEHDGDVIEARRRKRLIERGRDV